MKVLMLGLDGVSHSLIKNLAESGVMENTRELIQRGTLVSMDSTVPDLSAVAWTSMITGQNPGKHGVFGFTDFEPNSYKMIYTNSTYNRGKPIWDIFAEMGKTSVVVNLPGTYPARPIKGLMISGFVAIDLNKSVYPINWLDWLQEIGYRLDVDVDTYGEHLDYLLEDIEKTLKKRMEALLLIWEKVDWDLFVGIITETDRLHHYFWDAVVDETHRYHSDILGFYRWIDRFIGNLFDRCRSDSNKRSAFLMSSDHGFDRALCEVNVNEWLKEEGYLAYSSDEPGSLSDLNSGTRAFALDPARVFIHSKDRFPKGHSFESNTRDRLLGDLTEKLSSATVPVSGNGSGERLPLCRHVFHGEELYHGPHESRAPDLVLLPSRGVELKSKVTRHTLVDAPRLPGMHCREEAFFYVEGRGVGKEGRPSIMDLAPSIMHLAKIPKPLWSEMDGKNIVLE